MKFRVRDEDKAFKNAKSKGLEYMDYMYMYSDMESRKDYFKHIMTREYQIVEYGDEENSSPHPPFGHLLPVKEKGDNEEPTLSLSKARVGI